MLKRISIYTRTPEEFDTTIWPKNYVVSFYNPRFFELATDTVDGMWAREQHIINAYNKLGVPLIMLPEEGGSEKSSKPEPKVTAHTQADEDVVTVSEIEDEAPEEAPVQEPEPEVGEGDTFPSDWRDLSWPKLRGLAGQFSDGAVKDKKEAIAIMEEAEKQYS